MLEYFISYHTRGLLGEMGVCNTIVTVIKPLNNMEQIRYVEDCIKDSLNGQVGQLQRPIEDVVISNFILIQG